MENNLPHGWAKCSLIDLCSKPQYGWTTKAGGSGFVKYLRTTDISRGDVAWDLVPYCVEEPNEVQKYQVKKDDILVSRAGSVGFNHRIKDDVPFDAVFASYLIRFQPYDESLAHYIEYFLKSEEYWSQISDFTAGIAIPNVNASKLEQLDIPLPPECEIKRIIDKLNSLFEKIETNKKRLEKIPQILKRFRQSVLASAVCGRLTEEWRKNTDFKVSFNLSNQFEINETYKELHDIPANWRWIALGNYAKCNRGRFSIRPRNDPRYYGGDVPFIQIGDLPKEGGLISSHTQTLNEKGLAVSKIFPKNSLVIAIVGATIANTGILKYDMCFPDSLVGIDMGDLALNLFLDYYIRIEKENLRQLSYAGGGQPNIKLELLNAYPFPLPPSEEQHEIVKRIEKYFSFADKIESRYLKAKAQLDKLPQSILAKAFRGELVPQYPEDEPANLLLERILTSKRKK